jgi:C4-dicarboxylate transporter DctM subunit
MEWYVVAILAFVAMFAVVFAKVPIAFGLGLLGLLGLWALLGGKPALAFLGNHPFSVLPQFTLVAVPLFIFMAEVILFTGISGDVFDLFHKWLDRLPGALAISGIIASAGFGAMSGSSTATAAGIGSVAIPEMQKRGYDDRLAAGSVAAGGGLGILIPPSLPLIFYGIITQTSVGKVFMATLIPGVIMAALESAYVGIVCKRNPRLAPRIPGVSWRDRAVSLKKVWPILVLIFLVLGSIYLGWATVTEAAAVGAFGSLCFALAYKKLNWSNLRGAMLATVRATGAVLIILVGALLFGYFLTVAQVPQQLSSFLVNLPVNRWVIMIGINMLLLLLGCVMEMATLMLVILPILFPPVVALGFDPIWFGAVFVINVQTGLVTPPIGMDLFVVKGISNISMVDIMRGAVPFTLSMIIVLILTMAFPQLSLWIPSLMG